MIIFYEFCFCLKCEIIFTENYVLTYFEKNKQRLYEFNCFGRKIEQISFA